jgi:hypothetical protein
MKGVQVMILKSPADRLRGLLEITQRNLDVEHLSDTEALTLVDMLATIAHRRPSRAEVAEGLLELSRWFFDLTSQASAELPVGRGSLVYLLTEDGDLQRTFSGSFAVALIDEAASLLQRAGAHRLRRCPLRLPRTGEICGRLFIGERHQKYCTPPHAQIQARRESRRRERESS